MDDVVAPTSAVTGLSLGDRVDDVIARTTAAIDESWARASRDLVQYPAEAAELTGMLARMTGGKLLRSRLAVATYLGLGGTSEAVSDALSAGIQLIHVGLCVHDDLIDGDARRHGRPNVSGMAFDRAIVEGSDPERAEREALAAGLLAGDLAIARGQRLLLGAPIAPEARVALMEETLDALAMTIGGEWLDVRSETAPPRDVPTDAIDTLKTARYTTMLPVRLGVLARGGVDAQTTAVLTNFGEALGVAYQMKDDELGVFGDPAATGKSATADLTGGKRTGLLRLAYELADDVQSESLNRLVGRANLTPDEADELRGIIQTSGARQRHHELMAGRVRDAVTEMSQAPGIPADLKRYLTAAAGLVVPRES